MNEIWKPLKESPNCQISNFGRIWRQSSQKECVRKGTKFVLTSPPKFVVGPKLSPKGYPRVTLMGKQYFVHSLVAKYFIPNPDNKPQVNHIDGNKLNNRVDNLEWVTNLENRDHAVLNGLIARGEKLSKLTTSQVLSIRTEFANGSTIAAIARKFIISHQAVSKIVRRKSWRHI